MNTPVLAEHLSRPIYDIPAPEIVLARVGFHQRLIVAETDILAFLTIGNRQPHFSCMFPDFALLHCTARKQCVLWWVLTQGEKKIGHIFLEIHAPEKRSAPGRFFVTDPAVFPRAAKTAPQD